MKPARRAVGSIARRGAMWQAGSTSLWSVCRRSARQIHCAVSGSPSRKGGAESRKLRLNFFGGNDIPSVCVLNADLHLAAKPLLIFGIGALGFDIVLHELEQQALVAAVAGLSSSRKGRLQFGIRSVAVGQLDVALSLGHGYWQAFRYVIVPQT